MMDETQKNSARLTNLESSLMHLQNDFDALNEVVLDQSRRLDQLTKMIERLTERFEQAAASESPRRAEDEKPPHY
jgi:uncharacterized coiled-coil protein SlyX